MFNGQIIKGDQLKKSTKFHPKKIKQPVAFVLKKYFNFFIG